MKSYYIAYCLAFIYSVILVYRGYCRGKYKPPSAPSDGEKPLYLHISAGAHVSNFSYLHLDAPFGSGRLLIKFCPSLNCIDESFFCALLIN